MRRTLPLLVPLLVAGCFRDNPLPGPATDAASPFDAAVAPDAAVIVDMARLQDIPPPPPCPDGTQLVYVVDANRRLSRFRPESASFVEVGTLDCPGDPNDTPFSMAVQRDGTAWVLFASGQLDRVDTTNAHCRPSGYQPDIVNRQFGMGFTADAPMSLAETLYLAVDRLQASPPVPGLLATLDINSLTMQPVARFEMAGSPELSGGDDGQLWGFFPDPAAPTVARIDKQTAQLLDTYPLPDLAGPPEDWAFARWMGDFYIFLRRTGDPSTRVYRLHANDGSVEVLVPDSGRNIVGGGVSLCTTADR